MFGLEKLFKQKQNYDAVSTSVVHDYGKTRVQGKHPYLCYAPFKSVYFGHHGRAIACCYNRKHIIGEYPGQSIKQIWFGAKANQLRDYMKHNDLSLGCSGCRQQMLVGNYDGVKARQYDERRMNANRYPSVMEFELSNTCNLECAMCSGDFSSLIRTKREKLPPLENPYDDNFVNQLEEFIPYLEEVKFYGGEPFLIEIYYRIWEKIMEINPAVRISVQTNATVLNNRVKRILENTNFHINVSFDSLQKETYESIRVNAGFERTFENLLWFREYCRQRNTFFGISMCAMQQNWREMPDFISFCNQQDVPVYFHTVLFPPHASIRNLAPEQIKEVADYLGGFAFAENTPVQKKNSLHYQGITNQVKGWYESSVQLVKAKKLESFAQLEGLLVQHIMNDKSLGDETRIARVQKIKSKLAELEKQTDPALLAKVAPHFDLTDPFLFDNLALNLEKMTPEALVNMAKATFK